MADPNYGRGMRDRYDRERSFTRQQEQFDTGHRKWSDDEARFGQRGDDWRAGGYGYDGDYGYAQEDRGHQRHGGWGHNRGPSRAEEEGVPRSYWRSWRDRGGPSYGSFRGDDIGGHDFNTPQFTNRTPYPGYYGAGSRLAANRGEWRPLGAAPAGSYADDREWGGGRDDGRSWLERAGEAVSGWFSGDDDDHREERGYRGHGPSGYTRSDERIMEDACDALTQDWGVDARQISVTVSNGEVTLDGTVPSRQQKRRAEDCVDDLSGVTHVQNNLRVQQPQSWDRNSRSGDDRGHEPGSGSI